MLRCHDSEPSYRSHVTKFRHWLYSLKSFLRGLFTCHQNLLPVALLTWSHMLGWRWKKILREEIWKYTQRLMDGGNISCWHCWMDVISDRPLSHSNDILQRNRLVSWEPVRRNLKQYTKGKRLIRVDYSKSVFSLIILKIYPCNNAKYINKYKWDMMSGTYWKILTQQQNETRLIFLHTVWVVVMSHML